MRDNSGWRVAHHDGEYRSMVELARAFNVDLPRSTLRSKQDTASFVRVALAALRDLLPPAQGVH